MGTDLFEFSGNYKTRMPDHMPLRLTFHNTENYRKLQKTKRKLKEN